MVISRKVFSTEMCFQSELNFSTLYRGGEAGMEQLHKQKHFLLNMLFSFFDTIVL